MIGIPSVASASSLLPVFFVAVALGAAPQGGNAARCPAVGPGLAPPQNALDVRPDQVKVVAAVSIAHAGGSVRVVRVCISFVSSLRHMRPSAL